MSSCRIALGAPQNKILKCAILSHLQKLLTFTLDFLAQGISRSSGFLHSILTRQEGYVFLTSCFEAPYSATKISSSAPEILSKSSAESERDEQQRWSKIF